MEISWQNIFYITTSVVMIFTAIICVWIMSLLLAISRIVPKFNHLVIDIKLKFLNFLLSIMDNKPKKL